MEILRFFCSGLAALSLLSATAKSTVIDMNEPPAALSGRNIALWQSHGRYYDASEDRWKWQRCRLFGTVEDLYTRSYVVPLLVPMLENAGAEVWLPRERDASEFEMVIDPDGESAFGGYAEHDGKYKWSDAREPGFGLPKPTLMAGENPFRMGGARTVRAVKEADKASTASWSAPIARRGDYAVYVSYPPMEKAAGDARYVVNTAIGPREFSVDQSMGAGTWVYLGTFPFEASKDPRELVTLTNVSATDGAHVGADAVRIGGGMGSVMRGADEREATVSGMPRWAEGARYWLQYAGMPDSIYASEESDYRDDIFCRPQWVNYLMQELNVPIDLTLAFHSDAGTLGGDSIVGTLGIFYTAKKRGKYADGRSRRLGESLARSVVGSVTSDIRALYDSTWTQRPLRDAKYIEARIPEVPTMLLELLSHQNLADMRYGLDPQFKFTVARAVYKGMLRYLADRGVANYIVQPLAPQELSLTSLAGGSYRLAWQPQADPLEPTARPAAYVVEVREGADASAPFKPLAETAETHLFVNIPAGQICSYRVVARNGGGRSFPSEILAAGYLPSAKGEVTVVNGFTLTSAPDVFAEGNMAGFGLPAPAVVAGEDLSFTGVQYDFDRTAPWVHDDQPGFGASRADMETKPVYGNSFDNVLTHGAALMACGYSFDSQSVAAFIADSRQPRIVDLILGLQKETKVGAGHRPAEHRALPDELCRRLQALAEAGTALIVSGAYVGSEAGNDATAREFAAEVLGIGLCSGNASTVGRVREVRSPYSAAFSGGTFGYSNEIGMKPYAVVAPDAIIPVRSGASTIMRYDDNQSPAAVAFVAPAHRAATFGFPLEAVSDAGQRKKLINQILEFLK